MKKLVPLVALALLAMGCNSKIKKYADNIDNMALYPQQQASMPSVNMGSATVPVDGVAGQVANAATDVIIDGFEIEMANRLNKIIEPDRLTERMGTATEEFMNEKGPFPVNQDSRWQLYVNMNGWGLTASESSVASAYMYLDIEGYGPKGKRIYSRSLTCTIPLSSYVGLSVGAAQTAANIGAITAMSDKELRKVFQDLSEYCGREAAMQLKQVVGRAR
ncbi:MAG: hypothetical protein RIT28_4928 [Pseudomonadota bacterium]